MAKKPTETLSSVMDLLSPLSSEERHRIVRAAFVLLGETPISSFAKDDAEVFTGEGTLPAKAKLWAKQNGITQEMLAQVFHVKDGIAQVIAEVPGGSQREKTINAYILTGISQFVVNGETRFSDQLARDLCNASGCYSSTNHATYLKDRGSDFTGSRTAGWILTSPGLKRGAGLIKSLAATND